MTALTWPVWLPTGKSQKNALPPWLVKYQEQQRDLFSRMGLPTRRDDRWKYTDLTFLLSRQFTSPGETSIDRVREVVTAYRKKINDEAFIVMVNGEFVPSVSDTAVLPEGVTVCGMGDALREHEALIKAFLHAEMNSQQCPFAVLNTALFSSGLFFHVPEAIHIDKPVHLLFLALDQSGFIANPRQVMILGKASRLTLVEHCCSVSSQSYFMNSVTQISAGEACELDYVKWQNEQAQAVHMAHYFVSQKKDSRLVMTNLTAGGAFSRDDVMVNLSESGAECRTGGFYRLSRDDQYVDHHININHAAPHSNSEMLFKGILDKKSRAVFNGRLHVEKGSQKITAYQANHNLLLSDNAEIYSKPELEIYADDVKCKHGATIGQLDQDAMFYLCSRGIEKKEAQSMLMQGFADEIFERITHDTLRLHAKEWMRLP